MPMDYRDAMTVLSQCGLGAALLGENEMILSVNETGGHLLHGEGELEGRSLWEIAPQLCQDSEEPLYANIAFGEYLLCCPTPEVSGLPPHSRLIVFRNAANDACHDMLINVLGQISEAVILCDEKGRIYLLNDAAIRMDTIETRDVLGKEITEVYYTQDATELLIPQVIRSKRPKTNIRQYYTTCFGRDVDIMANSFPIVQNGQVLGGFSVMEDWSKVDTLHQQIIDLQEKLLNSAHSDGQKQKKKVLRAKYKFQDIICVSPAMSSVVAQCKQIADSSSSVMIYGETGTGKELFAQSIHNASRRADGPFLAINCAAIPENLLEGLLFGTERGAYTGAEQRAGLFEQADGGTLLLDEINSMNINLQSKLLRVLQEGMVRRVGGIDEIPIDVRVLSNINIPPHRAIAENKMRQDLFYRLGVININLPPLRERGEDIPILAKHFVMNYNKILSKNVRNINKLTLKLFQKYQWPGNVRELQHAIEYAMNLLPDDLSMITPDYVPEYIYQGCGAALPTVPALNQGRSLNGAIQDIEYGAICKVLQESGGNISEAARILKLSRQNLQYRIKRYQINIEELLRE